MNRRFFIQSTGMLGAGLLINSSFMNRKSFPVVRVPQDQRNFTSEAVEKAIEEFNQGVKDKELSWLMN
ncbi:MAG: hypothetical protein MI975_17350 [Cytophagales bacterium]|nr:hypothetical protein [Cytophagales bacterium]